MLKQGKGSQTNAILSPRNSQTENCRNLDFMSMCMGCQ